MPITTLLFDLDGTLLDNDTDKFIPVYLKLFASHVAPQLPPEKFVAELLSGTRQMITNNDFRFTLEEKFGAHFYPAMDVAKEKIEPTLNEFYEKRFGELRGETKVIPSARVAAEWAAQNRLKVGIATNALFPRSAILQRLDWANMGAHEFNYGLITTFEFMHFAKPSPEYYAETLAWMDSRPEETLMIGNEWKNDIAPAYQVGINTFWVAPRSTHPPAETASPVGQGNLTEFVEWANNDCLNVIKPLPISSRAARAQVAAIPSVMIEITKHANWKKHPQEEWSLTEIACHLRDVEIEINQPRLRKILSEANPFIAAIDSDEWALPRGYAVQDGAAAFAAFVEARRETLTLLDGLADADWKRTARHGAFGPTTLQELVSFTVEHDRTHLRQMRELVEVGS
jgi:FMN phosphatase YigB (HAD superfamily)